MSVAAVLLAAAGPAPQRTPVRFTSQNYGLTIGIPPGLSHCPRPAGSVALDHGIIVYLTPPTSCDADGPAAVEEEAARLPQIRFFYQHNVADIAGPGGQAPPRTNSELHRQACAETHPDWPAPMEMLGVPAAICFENRDGAITLAVGALYTQAPIGAFPVVPDSQAWLLLQTSARRYTYDLKTFQTMLKSVALCRPPDRPPHPPRPGCPPVIPW